MENRDSRSLPQDGVIAPCLFEGRDQLRAFQAHVEEALPPTLRPDVMCRRILARPNVMRMRETPEAAGAHDLAAAVFAESELDRACP